MEQKKFIASFEQTVQTTEDTWKVRRYNLEVTANTKVEEIIRWKNSIAKDTLCMEITIMPLFELQK